MSSRIWKFLAVICILLCAVGCAAPGKITPTPAAAVVTEATGRYPKLFVQSTTCAGCHDNLKDSKGAAYSISMDWAGSMHASAARDPYFIATVRSEVVQHQELSGVIESTCATCHFPMARTTALSVDEPVKMLDEGYIDQNHPLNQIGMDGVSCQLCHQVQPDGLGETVSYNGGYVIDLETPSGERPLFGPFQVSDSTVQLKKAVLGSEVEQAQHLAKPEFCAACHTLYTTSVDADGQKQQKPFPEQMVYLEWQNSTYHDQKTCQQCHMPQMKDGAVIANLGGLAERKPVSQHTFIGANSYMVELVGANRETLNVTTDGKVFQDAARATQDYLRTEAAQVSAKATREGSQLLVTVQVTNQTGHKLPSAYPSRRTWLHLSVKDASGKTLFESGEYTPDGKILQNDNDLDAAQYEPHYDLITNAAQVQIYEAIMGNTDGAVTTELLRASKYLKDNRLLPAGFDKGGALDDVRVIGNAADDATFAAGGDLVSYQVHLPEASGPITVSVELLYQSIGYRWAQNIGSIKTSEGQAFLAMVAENPPAPVLIAEAQAKVQ